VPPVGATVNESPDKVQIWFNALLEPIFSRIEIKDAGGDNLDIESRVNPDDQHILEAELPELEQGEYHVYWRAVARDGHRTQGDYTFRVKP
jgi:methionine-rich copper-binding protein CopC